MPSKLDDPFCPGGALDQVSSYTIRREATEAPGQALRAVERLLLA